MNDFDYNPPTEPWLDTIYKDKDMIVFNKPAGILSVPGRDIERHDSIYSRLLAKHPNSHTVHRLDLATSGVIIFALRKDAERALKMQFQERETKKIYYARVFGHVKNKTGCIDVALSKDTDNPPKHKIALETGKACKTFYEVISYGKQSTLVKLMPVTGRTHQLRLHMLAIGHPILGDDFYADPVALALSPRLLLHATEISIKHPYTKKMVCFKTEVPFIEPDALQ
ncbi:RNA pseudouridine synthase [Psychromonas sp. RZ22]|uniref:pseudouridine synthase n=1 Tax=Psychromonas algarum TaxID=2555643 RepID=UPI0010684C23|nr:pseudouridine synthase [Psychromonas sp. RZ22]TEW55006.1 RNA pseudouridine synthase [Psychromonas sp. RZ22]